jgi:hypothetical protein
VLLGPICRPFETASELAQSYFTGSAGEKKRIAARLAAYGITQQHIQAKATELAHASLLLIDRTVTTRESARRLLLKDLEKREAVEVDRDPDNVPVAPVSETHVAVN